VPLFDHMMGNAIFEEQEEETPKAKMINIEENLSKQEPEDQKQSTSSIKTDSDMNESLDFIDK